MRQYRLFYKRGKAAGFSTIQPGGLHDNLIDHQQIRDAIEHMRVNPHVEGMSLRLLGDEVFNVIAFDQEAEAPNVFKFAPYEPPVADEPDTVLAEPEAPASPSLLTAAPDLRVTHYADGRVEVRPLNTINGRTPEQLRADAQQRSFAEAYGVNPAQQPVDGDTANDGLTNH